MPGRARANPYTVMNLNDSGPGSLRDAINQANTAGGTNTIEFMSGLTGTITITSVSLPAITNDLSIMGPVTAPGITINGNHSSRAFQVNTGFNVSLQNLTVTNGSAARTGGAIFNNGSLTIDNCTFSQNQAVDASTDFPFAQGGAIDNAGSLTISNSTFTNNEAVESAGSSNPPNLAQGGAIFTDTGTTLTITNSTFSGNKALNPGTSASGSPSVSGSPTANGGAISGNTGSTMTITNCTFSVNEVSASATAGGAIATAAPSIENLKGTLLAGKAAGGNCSIAGTLNDNGYNLSDDGSCNFSGTSQDNVTDIDLDPAGLRDNGGPTETIALEQKSRAVDFIPKADCTDQSSPTPQPLTADQRGFRRPDFGNPNFCDAGAFELTTMPFELNSEKLEIARSTIASNEDKINMALTFTELPSPMCDAGNDAFNGIGGELFEGTCASIPGTAAALSLGPFVTHTVGGVTYGTFFETLDQSFGTEMILARMVQLATPEGACGKWSLELELSGLDTVALGLGGGNPFGLILNNPDGEQQCFDIDDAIVGNQTPPPTRRVRRGVRR